MNNQTKTRKRRTPEEKLELLKRHLVKGEKVSDICEEQDIAPSQFYGWQQSLFDNGALALERKGSSSAAKESKRVQDLKAELDKTKAKLTNKHEVLSELMTEYIQLKKSTGD